MKWMTLIAIVCGYLWTDAAIADETPDIQVEIEKACKSMLEVAYTGYDHAKANNRGLLLTYMKAEFTGAERDMIVKSARWGFGFAFHSKERLAEEYMDTCMAAYGPWNMPEYDEREG